MNEPYTVDTQFRVRYAETDAMGIVHHANYVVWFEVGRVEYFRTLGQDYGQWEEEGYLLQVSEVHARYHAPARFGDLIKVRTWLEQIQSRSVTLRYEILNAASQQRLVTGWTKHISVDRQGKIRRLPKNKIEALIRSC